MLYTINMKIFQISERLDEDAIENNRKPKQMVVCYMQDIDGKDVIKQF